MKIDNGSFILNKTIENAAMEEITMAENFLYARGAQAKMCMCPPGVPLQCTSAWFHFNVSVRLLTWLESHKISLIWLLCWPGGRSSRWMDWVEVADDGWAVWLLDPPRRWGAPLLLQCNHCECFHKPQWHPWQVSAADKKTRAVFHLFVKF